MRRTAGALGEDGLGATVDASSGATDLGTIAGLVEKVGAGSVFATGFGGSRVWGVDGRSAVDDIPACGRSSSSIRVSCSGVGVIDGAVWMVVGLGGGDGDGERDGDGDGDRRSSLMGTSAPFGDSTALLWTV